MYLRRLLTVATAALSFGTIGVVGFTQPAQAAATGPWTIRTWNAAQCLDVENERKEPGARLIFAPCVNNKWSQHWYLEEFNDSNGTWYHILNRYTGNCVNVAGG